MSAREGNAQFDELGIPLAPGGACAMVSMANLSKTIHAVADRRVKSVGFRSMGDRAWIRTRKEPIREVIRTSCIKARVYFDSGFALPYLPVFSGRRVGMSAHPEKREQPIWIDGPAEKALKAAKKVEPELWTLGASAKDVHADFRKRVPTRIERALAMFDQVQTLPDLERELAAVCRRYSPGHYVRALPGHYLGLAFTRAMLGKRRLADRALEVFIRTHQPGAEQGLKLRKMLAETKPL